MNFRRWVEQLAELLLPGGCVSCGAWIPSDGAAPATLVCGRCRVRMREGPWPRCHRCHWPRGTGRPDGSGCRECAPWPDAIAAARFAFELASPVDDLVHGLKYEGWQDLALFMGDAMARVALPEEGFTGPPVVVPVPTSPGRLRARGYNQAALLAARLAARRGVPLVHALERPAAADSQTNLTPAERRRNTRGAFFPATEIRRARGRPVILVDDVLTTGATVSEAALTLAERGAGPVVVVTFARALPRRARVAA